MAKKTTKRIAAGPFAIQGTVVEHLGRFDSCTHLLGRVLENGGCVDDMEITSEDRLALLMLIDEMRARIRDMWCLAPEFDDYREREEKERAAQKAKVAA
jgi:hypothetical protein